MSTHDSTPPPLNTSTGKLSTCFWISTVLVIGSCALGIFLSIFAVPVFAEMFTDFGAELPKLTQVILITSNFMKSYFILIQLPIAGLLTLTIWGLHQLDKKKQAALMLCIGVVPVVLLGIYIIAMFLPIFGLNNYVGR